MFYLGKWYELVPLFAHSLLRLELFHLLPVRGASLPSAPQRPTDLPWLVSASNGRAEFLSSILLCAAASRGLALAPTASNGRAIVPKLALLQRPEDMRQHLLLALLRRPGDMRQHLTFASASKGHASAT
jgi:hypothetical protein